MPERIQKKKTIKKESKSKKVSVPSKLYKAIKACECECCGKDILKYIQKGKKDADNKSDDGLLVG